MIPKLFVAALVLEIASALFAGPLLSAEPSPTKDNRTNKEKLGAIATEVRRRRQLRDAGEVGERAAGAHESKAEPVSFVIVSMPVAQVARIYGQISDREVLVSSRVQKNLISASAHDLSVLDASVVIEKALRASGVKVVRLDLYTVALIPVDADVR